MHRRTARIKRSALAVGSAVLLMAGLQACNRSQPVETLLTEAKQYIQKGDNKAAVIQLKNAVQNNPENAEARFMLGTLYNDIGDFASAEKELNKAIELRMAKDKVIGPLAHAMLMLGEFQKLIDATAPTNGVTADAEIRAVRGSAYLGLRKPAEAKTEFEEALKLKADFPDALIGLARYSLSQKDSDAAHRYVEQAVERNPNNAEVWQFKGDLMRFDGKADEALAAYEKALAAKPNLTSAHLEKAYIEITRGKYDLAKADIDAAAKTSGNPLMIKYAQALLDHQQGKDQAALDGLQQVLKAAPEHMPSVLLAGTVQYALGHMKEAEAYLAQYQSRFPDNLYSRKMLASAMIKNNESQKAVELLEPILKDAPQDPQLFAVAGDAYIKTKQFDKATEYYQKAASIAPDTPGLHVALGMSKLGQGDSTRGIAELEAATKLDGKSEQAGFVLIMSELRLKEFDKALTAARQLEKEQPQNPMVQNLIGGAYLGKNDAASARTAFEKAVSINPTFYPALVNLVQLDLHDKKPEVAKKRLEAALEKDKKNIYFMRALADLAMTQKNPAEATQWLERASNENPESLPASLTLGNHYLRIGQKDKANTLARKLVASNGTNPEVLGFLAQTQLLSGDKDGALDSFQKIANVLPDDPRIQLSIAEIQSARNNEAGTIDALKKAVSTKPDFLEAQLGLVTVYMRKHDYDSAMTIARTIQKQRPKQGVGFEAEGNIYLSQKRSDQALKAYDAAYALEKSNSPLIKAAIALRDMGKTKDAEARITGWVKDHPNDEQVLMFAASTSTQDKQYKTAISQYQNILRINPKNAPALNNLAWLYQEVNDPKAVETAEKALELAPESPVVQDTLGWIYVQKGDTKKGVGYLEKAAAKDKTASDIHYHYAAALAKLGDKAKAKDELQTLLASGKSFPEADDARALLNKL